MDKFFFSKLFGDFRNEAGYSDNDSADAVDDHNGNIPREHEQDPFDSLFSSPFQNFDHEVSDIFQNMETMFHKLFFSSFESIGLDSRNERFSSEDNPWNYMFKNPEESQNLRKIMPPIFDEPFNNDGYKDTGLYNWNETFPTEENPRDYMLKNSQESKQPTKMMPLVFDAPLDNGYKDTDIDHQVADGLFSKRNIPLKLEEPSSSSYKFKKIVSIKTFQMPNVVLKEQQTFSDSNGKKVTKISRSIGDQTHEIITHSDEKGSKEKEENFFNLDENSLSDFEKKWQKLKNGNQRMPLTFSENEQEKVLDFPQKPLAPTGDSKYLSLLKKYFGLST